ncbi:hypothetical protein BCR33DRAFT_473253 [Rhizoclosmatium globosum]|uniref:Translation initiation factor IF2/IF5 domain-containing protein n=1 Tax=Rhizoclosmatium globosum TaxID=329046 RepID=A0A1Y2BQ55_9FUNG|nr:hypothetical protein BCR33DRAFT_473253 [Rhizoclosmatium globosum]|eukprot:ORY36882.1 hypothetical protein BCR33DRAFT_473253 [Rhizoclosmatium globosum]
MNDLPSAVNEEIVAMIQQLNIEDDYTSLTNINDISNALNRDIHHILKFIAIKLKATLNFEYMAVEGIFDIQTIQRALMEFIDMFVACSACGSQKTWLIALRRKPVSLFAANVNPTNLCKNTVMQVHQRISSCRREISRTL